MQVYNGQPGEDGFETPDPIEPDSALDAQEADKNSDRFYYLEGIQRLANVRFE